MILRNKIQGNFVMIPKEVLMDNTLKLRECGLICRLLSLPDNWDFTISGLMKITGEGRDSIRTSIGILMKKKYLVKYQERNANGSFGKIVIEVCPYNDDSPFSENPTSDKPISAEPTSENLPQYNNKQYKNNRLNNNGYKATSRKDKNNGITSKTNEWSDAEKDLYGI